MNHWYFVNQIGMATVCADKANAEKCASEADQAWPRHAPHVAMQLVDAAQMDSLIAALGACRDAMPDLPGIPIDEAIQHPEAVPDYVLATVTQLMAMIDTERTARHAAQRRIEDLQALLVRADAERCAAVLAAEKRWRKVVMAAVELACSELFDKDNSEQDEALEQALIEAGMIRKDDQATDALGTV